MTKIKIYNPGNEITHDYRYYNHFWDVFTEYLKNFFDTEEDRYYEFAHESRIAINLKNKLNETFELLECEYVIENLDSGEFVVLSVADGISSIAINASESPFLKKILLSQFSPRDLNCHVTKNREKYIPWTYFQSFIFDLEPIYIKRLQTIPSENKMYFRGTSLEDRPILYHINNELITTPFNPIEPNKYFNEMIMHKLALSVDGRGEFCYRDIECFAIGVPTIRFEYESKLTPDLIPNYHYVSIPRPDDMDLYRLGTKEHAKLLEKRYYEVINDISFLDFISKNARKYYVDNCILDNVLKNTYNLLGLNDWL
jgi:hypothetical protein